MNADTTPMNPTSFSIASVAAYIRKEREDEPRDLTEMFRMYGRLCFRNGFLAGFVTGVSVVAFAALKKV